MEKKKSNLYILAKTAVYRTISVSTNWLLLYVLTGGDVVKSSQYAIYMFILHTILYMGWEKFTSHMEEKYYYNKEKNET
jgi:uncharacterized membrane protein